MPRLSIVLHAMFPCTSSLINIQLKNKLRILGEHLLISSLPGKALRTFVDIARLVERSTWVLKAKPGKFDTRSVTKIMSPVLYFTEIV